VHTADIGVTQRGGGFGFPVETLAGFLVGEQVGGEKFEGNRALELGVVGLVDDTPLLSG